MNTPTPAPALSKVSGFLNLSREQAIEEGLIDPSPEELVELRALRIEQAKQNAADRAADRTQPGRPVTIDALLGALGWSAAYAQHRLHAGCTCTSGYDGDSDYLCTWAEDLGFTSTTDTPAPMTAAEVDAKAAARLADTVAMYERWDGKVPRIRDLFPTSFVTLSPITYPAGASVDYPMGSGR